MTPEAPFRVVSWHTTPRRRIPPSSDIRTWVRRAGGSIPVRSPVPAASPRARNSTRICPCWSAPSRRSCRSGKRRSIPSEKRGTQSWQIQHRVVERCQSHRYNALTTGQLHVTIQSSLTIVSRADARRRKWDKT